MTKIVVLAEGAIGTRMAAQGIRSTNIARVLQQQLPDAEVVLAVPPSSPCDLQPADVAYTMRLYSSAKLGAAIAGADVCVAPALRVGVSSYARNTRMVLDLYTPRYTEWLEVSKQFISAKHRTAWLEPQRKSLLAQLARADLVLCANERQRDFVAGMMGTAGMISRRNFYVDQRLERTIAIAPFGIRSKEGMRRAPLVKGVRPGIGADDFVLLFNGTIVEWYDTDLLIRAMRLVADRRNGVRLVFLGTEHPDQPGGPSFGSLGGGATRRAVDLARELGLLEKHVFFNFGWAGDATAEQHLLEADAGVSTYFDGLETRYSFRVRYLDLLWASLPMICTRGDVVSEMVERRGLGLTVPERDVHALAAAIERMASDEGYRASCRRNLDIVREEYRWERTLAPLVEFCRDPSLATVSRRERMAPLLSRSVDWAVSRAHYAVRYDLRKRLSRHSATEKAAS